MEDNWKVLTPIGGDGDRDIRQVQMGPAQVVSHRLTQRSINSQQVSKNKQTKKLADFPSEQQSTQGNTFMVQDVPHFWSAIYLSYLQMSSLIKGVIMIPASL